MVEQDIKCVYGSNGYATIEPTFYATYKTIPNIVRHRINKSKEQEIDIDKIDIAFLQQLFPNSFITYSLDSISDDLENKENEEDDDDTDVVFFTDRSIAFLIYSLTDKQIISIRQNYICLYSTLNFNVANKKISEIIKILPKKKKVLQKAEVNLVEYDNGYYTSAYIMDPVDLDINKCYNDDFAPVFKKIIKFITDRENGIVFLYGEAGTGKSTLLKYLTTAYPREYIIVTQSIASRMAEPEFITFMGDHKNSIFIMEDCEQIIQSRTSNVFGGAISNILNMSDGILSDIFNIKFICTFNKNFADVDSALLRPGRCFAKYEFTKLSKDKIKILADENNIKLSNLEAMTLAELFNQTDVNSEIKITKKIGF